MRVALSPCTLRIRSTPSAYPFNHRCSCGGALDSLGDHRAACATSGFLRSIPVERAVARICREAGGPVRTNIFLRDMNLPSPPPDARAIEVLVSGLPLWHGAQIAIDATWVSPIHRNGEPRPRAASEPGVTLHKAARRNFTQTYPEFQSSTRCRLAVFGLEVVFRSRAPRPAPRPSTRPNWTSLGTIYGSRLTAALGRGWPTPPQLLAETWWEDPPLTLCFWRAPADLGGWKKNNNWI